MAKIWLAKPFAGEYRISEPYGPRDYGDGFHDGTDYATPFSTAILMPRFGVVVAVKFGHSTYGNYIVTQHDHFCVLLAHLGTISARVGQVVELGEEIARSGNSGDSTGPHVHVEVRDTIFAIPDFWETENGKYLNSIDPETVIYPAWMVSSMQQGETDKWVTPGAHAPVDIPTYAEMLEVIRKSKR